MRARLSRIRGRRLLLLVPVAGALAGVAVWRAPDLDVVGEAFGAVEWRWVAAAVGINLVSVAVRAIAWQIVLDQAIPPPHLRRRYVFSAFSVGLLGNAVLPGRVGELARAAVLARRLPQGNGAWAAVLGSIFAHRIFDVVPTAGLVAYVLVAARIPLWARPGVLIVLAVGGGLLLAGLLLARRGHHSHLDDLGPVRRLLVMVRSGLGVLHAPRPALVASLLQALGWTTQLVAVWLTFKAFQIEAPFSAAALVLLVVNVALAFPLWPGAVGLFQAGVALALLSYHVSYHHGFVYGIGLQAIETAVGVGLGLLFLAREGISFAVLKEMPRVTRGGREEEHREAPAEPERPREPERRHEPARVPLAAEPELASASRHAQHASEPACASVQTRHARGPAV